MRILFIGDIVGQAGRAAVGKFVPALRDEFAADFVIANAENAAGGLGITKETARELFSAGVQCITMGNHTWSKREAIDFIAQEPRIIRPANYPPGTPGAGWGIFPVGDAKLAVMNLLGRIFMEPIDSPFLAADAALAAIREETPCVLVDFHAEATSEKQAMAWHLDSRVSAVLGTHTHVQTADERILPGGGAAITDVGMTGPLDSILGMRREAVLERMVTLIPARFDIAPGPRVTLSAVLMEIDNPTGRATSIERILRHESI